MIERRLVAIIYSVASVFHFHIPILAFKTWRAPKMYQMHLSMGSNTFQECQEISNAHGGRFKIKWRNRFPDLYLQLLRRDWRPKNGALTGPILTDFLAQGLINWMHFVKQWKYFSWNSERSLKRRMISLVNSAIELPYLLSYMNINCVVGIRFLSRLENSRKSKIEAWKGKSC